MKISQVLVGEDRTIDDLQFCIYYGGENSIGKLSYMTWVKCRDSKRIYSETIPS